MGNCTNKQDSPRNSQMLDIDKKNIFPQSQAKDKKPKDFRETSCSNKQSQMSTAENSNRNSGSLNSSSINIHQEGISGLLAQKQHQTQYPSHLEQIEEIESSYFQSEIRQLDSEMKHLNNNINYGNNQSWYSKNQESKKINQHKLITLKEISNISENCSVSQDSRDTQISSTRQSQNVCQISLFGQNSNQISHSRQSSNNSQISQISYTNSSLNSPTRMQRSQGSNQSVSPRLKDKQKTAQEIRNIIRMQTESYFSNLISIELNKILQKGEQMSTVMSHFKFTNYDQVLDLVRDIFNSIQNKKNKLTEKVLQEHCDILRQFIQQAQLLLERGITQLLKTQSKQMNMSYSNPKQMNMSYSNPSQDSKEQNLDLAIKTLEVVVEAYQIFQYFQLQASDKNNKSQNKWWTKNQNEKDLSSFYRKFVNLSQQLNAEFQEKHTLTPTEPKRSKHDKKNTKTQTQTINLGIPLKNSQSIEISTSQFSQNSKTDENNEDLQNISESNTSPFNNDQLYSHQTNFDQTGKEQSEKRKNTDSLKKNPINSLPLITLSNASQISQDQTPQKQEEKKQQISHLKQNYEN